jgi:signal peptidase I
MKNMFQGYIDIPQKYLRCLVSMMKENDELKTFEVVGTSMEPAIRKGAIVEVDKNIENIQVGEIIVFININHFTVHRVVNIINYENEDIVYITQGDATQNNQERVLKDDIIGRVVNCTNK